MEKLYIKLQREVRLDLIDELLYELKWDYHEQITVDFSEVDFIEISALTLLSAFLLGTKKIGLFKRGNLILPRNKDVETYIKRMNFYKILDVSVEEDFMRWNGTGRFQEIIQITKEDEVRDVVENLKEILKKRSELTKPFIEVMQYSLSEVLENVFHHADSPIGGLVSAQTYSTIGKVQFVIVDCGKGIPETLRVIPKYEHLQDEELIDQSIKLNVTSKKESNTGQGLFFVSEIIKRNGGILNIYSLNGSLKLESSKILSKTPFWQGTAIFFELPHKILIPIKDIFDEFAPPENDYELIIEEM